MAPTDPVHFYDLYSDLSGPSKSWSPNTLKVRAALNFKEIPYKQSWISYPDVKPLITGWDLPPNSQGIPYTLPAIVHKPSIPSNPHGAMMDSLPIVLHLDKTFDGPALFPSGDVSYALALAVNKIVWTALPAFKALIMPHVPGHLDPRGEKYFHETRAAWFGQPLSELRPTDQESINAIVEPVLAEYGVLVDMLKGKEGKKGPFFEGETPGFADLVLASTLAFVDRFDKELFERFLAIGDGELRACYEACLPWLEGQGEDVPEN